jgi:hypothetical protein
MPIQLPLAKLIQTQMEELGLDRQTLGFRLGYKNPAKAAGRVNALCWGHLTNRKSRAALSRLPDALGLSPELVQRAIRETEQVLAEQERQAEEERRLAREREEAEWRAAFRPHAIIQTERTVPSQITICGLTGGARRWLWIDFDLSKPPITFVQQALAALPERTGLGSDGKRYVTFFGEAVGFIVNYTPDQALRCDLDGQPQEVLTKAYRPGEVGLAMGGRPVSPTIIARLLGTT